MELDSVVCMDAYELLASLPDKSVDLLLTDAPYNTTACEWEMELDLPRWWALVKRILKPRGACVMTTSQPFTTRLIASNYEMFRYEWIWEKPNGTGYLNANRVPMKSHETIIVFCEKGTAYYPIMEKSAPYSTTSGAAGGFVRDKTVGGHQTINTGLRYPKTILRFDSEVGYHPTQKPVALFEYLIRTYTQAGDLVVDPFVGSGTTAVAARNLGRHFICGDQSAEYVAIANKRLNEPFTLPLFAEDVSAETPQTLAMFQEEG